MHVRGAAHEETDEEWAERIYNAIIKMVISSMATFQALLNVRGKRSGRASNDDQPSEAQRPLCKLSASLNGKDIVVSPTEDDVYRYLKKSVNHIVESAKLFDVGLGKLKKKELIEFSWTEKASKVTLVGVSALQNTFDP